MICCHLDDAGFYEALGPGLVQAVSFLRRPWEDERFSSVRALADLPVGKWPLDGERLFVSVEEPLTRPADLTPLESHRRFVDLQMTLLGEERMIWRPLGGLTPRGEWDLARDIRFYEPCPEGSIVDASDGRMVLFFPHDGHGPLVAPKTPAKIKKLVVKISWALLNLKG